MPRMMTSGNIALRPLCGPTPDIAISKGAHSSSNSISNLGSAAEGLMELAAEFFKRAEHYSLPNPAHCVKVKVEIMQRVEGGGGHLADDKKVPQIGSRKVPAGMTSAVRVGRGHVFRIPGIFDRKRPTAREELTVPCVPCGQHTIKEVYPARDAFNQVVR